MASGITSKAYKISHIHESQSTARVILTAGAAPLTSTIEFNVTDGTEKAAWIALGVGAAITVTMASS